MLNGACPGACNGDPMRSTGPSPSVLMLSSLTWPVADVRRGEADAIARFGGVDGASTGDALRLGLSGRNPAPVVEGCGRGGAMLFPVLLATAPEGETPLDELPVSTLAWSACEMPEPK